MPAFLWPPPETGLLAQTLRCLVAEMTVLGRT